MKRLINLVILILMILSLSGCSDSGSEKDAPKTNIILLHGWGTMSSGDVTMREIYSNFTKANTDIELTLVSMPSFDSLEAKVKNMLAVGKMPNIIYTGTGSLETLYTFMVEKNNAVDLLPFIKEDKDFEKSISPEILKRWKTEDGRLYTVTDVMDNKGYWYNKKIFSHAGIHKTPTTWKEFSLACEKIRNWANREGWDTVVMDFEPKKTATLLQAIINEDKIFQSPVGKNKVKLLYGFKDMKNLLLENQVKQVDNIDKDPLFSFKIGHSAIYIGEVWEEKEFLPNMEVGYAPFPSSENGLVTQESVAPGYIISNQGNKLQIEAGIRFLKYMLSDEIQERILKEVGRIPTNPGVSIELIKNSRRRLYENYSFVKKAKKKIETAENSWDSYMYRKFVEKVPFYLLGEMDESGLYYEMTGANHLKRKGQFSKAENENREGK